MPAKSSTSAPPKVLKERSIGMVDRTVLDASRRLKALDVNEVDTSLPPNESYSWALSHIQSPFDIQDTFFDLLPPPELSLPEELIDQWMQREKKKYAREKETGEKKTARRTTDTDWHKGIDTKLLTKEQFQALFLPAAEAELGDGEGRVCAIIHCQCTKIRQRKEKSLIDGHVVCLACWQFWHSHHGVLRNAALCASAKLADDEETATPSLAPITTAQW